MSFGKALTAITFVSIAVTAYLTSPLWTKRPFKETYEERQVECLAATALVDTKGEKPEKRPLAQELVVHAVMKQRESGPKGSDGKPVLSFCTILEKVLTLYPEGWQHPITFRGRSLLAIKKPFINLVNSEWTEALAVANRMIEQGVNPKRCATHYVRPDPGYTWLTSELEAQKVIRTWKRDLTTEDLLVEYYCKP